MGDAIPPKPPPSCQRKERRSRELWCTGCSYSCMNATKLRMRGFFVSYTLRRPRNTWVQAPTIAPKCKGRRAGADARSSGCGPSRPRSKGSREVAAAIARFCADMDRRRGDGAKTEVSANSFGGIVSLYNVRKTSGGFWRKSLERSDLRIELNVHKRVFPCCLRSRLQSMIVNMNDAIFFCDWRAGRVGVQGSGAHDRACYPASAGSDLGEKRRGTV